MILANLVPLVRPDSLVTLTLRPAFRARQIPTPGPGDSALLAQRVHPHQRERLNAPHLPVRLENIHLATHASTAPLVHIARMAQRPAPTVRPGPYPTPDQAPVPFVRVALFQPLQETAAPRAAPTPIQVETTVYLVQPAKLAQQVHRHVDLSPPNAPFSLSSILVH
ncbi:hypothetical protein FRC09_001190 [Ceratobasidium sp. 395]|nr:hypothetical protein FRC09_001190 [Ceratobasidium sp. 395]